MGNKSSTPSQTKTTTVPWSQQQPYLLEGFKGAEDLYKGSGPSYYPGSTVSPFNPNQIAGQNQALNFAQNIAPGLVSGTNSAYQFALSAPDVANNPYVAAAATAAARPIYQNLTESVLPNIRSGASLSGQYGGSRQGIAEGLAAQSANQAAADQSANIYNQAYAQGLDAQGRAIALGPQTLALGAYPGQIISGVGDVQQGQAQNELNSDIARYNYGQTLPYQKLAEFMNTIQGSYGGTSTSTGPSTQSPGALQSGLGGAALGASLGSAIPGIGTGIGAGVGGLLGLVGLL
jgi:hypothetical protein